MIPDEVNIAVHMVELNTNLVIVSRIVSKLGSLLRMMKVAGAINGRKQYELNPEK